MTRTMQRPFHPWFTVLVSLWLGLSSAAAQASPKDVHDRSRMPLALYPDPTLDVVHMGGCRRHEHGLFCKRAHVVDDVVVEVYAIRLDVLMDGSVIDTLVSAIVIAKFGFVGMGNTFVSHHVLACG